MSFYSVYTVPQASSLGLCVWSMLHPFSQRPHEHLLCSSVLDSAVAVGLWQRTWQRWFRSPLVLRALGRETDLTSKCLNKKDNF